VKKHYKLKDLDDGQPIIRFYPNEVSGKKKVSASIAIKIDTKSKDFQPILKRMSNKFDHPAQEIPPRHFNDYVIEQAKT